VLLLATDLDQRLLPDVLTLPLIPIAVVLVLAGLDPFVAPADLPLAAVVAVAAPLALYALSIPFGAGAFGLGDVKFLVGFGILAGPERFLVGLVSGSSTSRPVIVALLPCAGSRCTRTCRTARSDRGRALALLGRAERDQARRRRVGPCRRHRQWLVTFVPAVWTPGCGCRPERCRPRQCSPGTAEDRRADIDPRRALQDPPRRSTETARTLLTPCR
jgi:hypothetical protein